MKEKKIFIFFIFAKIKRNLFLFELFYKKQRRCEECFVLKKTKYKYAGVQIALPPHLRTFCSFFLWLQPRFNLHKEVEPLLAWAVYAAADSSSACFQITRRISGPANWRRAAVKCSSGESSFSASVQTDSPMAILILSMISSVMAMDAEVATPGMHPRSLKMASATMPARKVPFRILKRLTLLRPRTSMVSTAVFSMD